MLITERQLRNYFGQLNDLDTDKYICHRVIDPKQKANLYYINCTVNLIPVRKILKMWDLFNNRLYDNISKFKDIRVPLPAISVTVYHKKYTIHSYKEIGVAFDHDVEFSYGGHQIIARSSVTQNLCFDNFEECAVYCNQSNYVKFYGCQYATTFTKAIVDYYGVGLKILRDTL